MAVSPLPSLSLFPLLILPLLYPIADAEIDEGVGGMVGVVPKLSAKLLRRSAHPLRVAEISPFRTGQTTTASRHPS